MDLKMIILNKIKLVKICLYIISKIKVTYFIRKENITYILFIPFYSHFIYIEFKRSALL